MLIELTTNSFKKFIRIKVFYINNKIDKMKDCKFAKLLLKIFLIL